jgi:LL-diaminopimelate aminotransferase
MNRKLKPASRVIELPPYLFKEIDDKKEELKAQGKELLNFGIGDPDLPTPDFVVQALNQSSGKNENQKYPAYNGSKAFRKAIAEYMQNRFNVTVCPDSQTTSLIGSKEGLAHFSWAFLEEGDIALVPDPGYPVYATTAKFSGAEVYEMPLLEENNFFPDLNKIPDSVLKRAKVIFINYPNNPTGAIATKEQMKVLIDWAVKNQIIVVSDAAYAEMVFDPKDRYSLLSIEGADQVVLEFHSFSKTFNMTGWRLGFAVGNKNLIQGLVKIKTNVDSGVFDAVQLAGIEALKKLPEFVDELITEYKKRKDSLIQVLKKVGMSYFPPAGTFYVLAKCPKGYTSKEYTIKLMDECGVVTTPGSGFGKSGEGYVRFALTQPVEIIEKLFDKLSNLEK